MTDPTDAASRHWDVIIIGTGVGGATVGHSLAIGGHSVLFLEKGGRISPAEESNAAVTPEFRMAQGWWPNPISCRQANGDRTRVFAAIGCALGGTSIHYAAVLERMAPSDFDGLYTPSASTSPWPVSF